LLQGFPFSLRSFSQCECGFPVPHNPQLEGRPVQTGSAFDSPPLFEANVESFFVNFVDPHCGQGVPCHWDERTRTSLSLPQFSQ
jgi:hypothetical protein